MESLVIDILNPKAKRLLQNLADLNLIRIKKKRDKTEFNRLLERLRENAEDAPTLGEITKEVKTVRKSRYED